MLITPQQKCNNISDFSLRAFLFTFCEQDVQSFTVARWTDLLPYIVNSRNGQGNFCLKGVCKGPLKRSKKSPECWIFKGITIDTNHTHPPTHPLPFYISFYVIHHPYIDIIATNPCQARAPWLYLHVYNECLSTGIRLISRWESPPAIY